MSKKSYNPFKMWGSYVGLVLYPLLTIIFYASNINKEIGQILFFPLYPASWITGVIPSSGMQGLGYFLLIGGISLAVSGFLIGWLIHALIRRIRK